MTTPEGRNNEYAAEQLQSYKSEILVYPLFKQKDGRSPIDLGCVIDESGSISAGGKIDLVKEKLNFLISNFLISSLGLGLIGYCSSSPTILKLTNVDANGKEMEFAAYDNLGAGLVAGAQNKNKSNDMDTFSKQLNNTNLSQQIEIPTKNGEPGEYISAKRVASANALEYNSQYRRSQIYNNFDEYLNKYGSVYIDFDPENNSLSNGFEFIKDFYDTLLLKCGRAEVDKFFNKKQKMIHQTVMQQIHNKLSRDNAGKYLSKVIGLNGCPVNHKKMDNKYQEDSFFNHRYDEEKIDDTRYEHYSFWKGTNLDLKFHLKYEFEHWMKDEEKSKREFKNEFADLLNISPSYIKIGRVSKGSTKIEVWLRNVWYIVRFFRTPDSAISTGLEFKMDEQIEIEYKGNYYQTTVIEKTHRLVDNIDQFYYKVRYNRDVDGEHRFEWRNTEWIYTLKEEKRIKRHQLNVAMEGGQRVGVIYTKPIANDTPVHDVNDLDKGHYLEYSPNNSKWYKCRVIKREITRKGIEIQVMVLFTDNIETIKLWNDDKRRIRLLQILAM